MTSPFNKCNIRNICKLFGFSLRVVVIVEQNCLKYTKKKNEHFVHSNTENNIQKIVKNIEKTLKYIKIL